jgi:hypothetical protein
VSRHGGARIRANTLRAWNADWAVFGQFCARQQLASLPAAALTMRAFVFDCLRKEKNPQP